MSDLAVERAEEATQPPSGVKARGSILIGTAGTLALNLSTTAINFVLALVLARALGSAGYGAYAYAFAWATFLSVPAALGLTPLVIRHVASYAAHEQWGLLRGVIRRTHQVVLATSVLLVAGAALVDVLVQHDDTLQGPFLIGLLLVPLTSLTSLRQGVLKGLNRVILGRLSETLIAPGLFLLFAAAAWVLLDDRFTASWAMSLNVAAAALAFVVGTVILWRVLPARVRAAEPEDELRAWVRSGIPLLAIGLLLVANAQIGTILLGPLKNAEAAGVFNIAAKVSAFTSFLFLAASYPLYPAVARLWATGEKEELQRVLTRTTRLVLLGSLLVGAVFLVFAGPLMRFFGGDFGAGATALRILTVAELIKVFAGFGGLALIMTPFESSMARGMALAFAINVPLSVALIPLWGATGAAIGSAVGVSVSTVYVTWLAWRKLGIYSPAFGRPHLRRGPAS